MSEVWCVIGGLDGRSGLVADALIARGNAVAIPSADVSSFAMLVNRHHDAVMPVETADAELDTLRDALDAIEESFGAIDVIAVIPPMQDLPRSLPSPDRLRSISPRSTSASSDTTASTDAATARISATAHTFVHLRPDASIVIVTGPANDDDAAREADLRVLNAALESRLRKAVAGTSRDRRQVCVATTTEIIRSAPPAGSEARYRIG